MTLTLSPMFCTHAVLQREKPVVVWGRDDPGSTILVHIADAEAGTTADKDGYFEVTLQPLEAGGPYTLEVTSDTGHVVCEDVMIGDLWVAAGQSNMELTMGWVRNTVPWDCAEADQPNVRQFFVEPAYDFRGTKPDLNSGEWVQASPETIDAFTAAGYFFARRIQQQAGVTIGIVSTAVGGTPVRAWTPREGLVSWPDEIARLDEIAEPGHVDRVIAEETQALADHAQGLDAADLGIQEKWYESDIDDSSWETHEIYDPWDDTSSGAVWMRTTIDVPEDCAGPATLYLGAFQDANQVWINGQFIGETTYRFLHSQYEIPSLPAGRVVIAVRIMVHHSQGEVTPGKFRLLHTPSRDWDLNSAQWKVHRGTRFADQPPTTEFLWEPAGCFNAMIYPLRKLQPTGVIWYQGESDDVHVAQYTDRFEAMVRLWRDMWGNVPFIWVELAHWAPTPEARDTWANQRRAQRMALRIPNTAMVACEDIGDANDLHPMNKLMVGERLAWAALQTVYDLDPGFSPYVIRSTE